MKVAVLSDIHGNLPALQTAAAHVESWRPDFVIVNGDIVNRGPLSPQCLHLVQARQQRHGWQIVRGNHEDYVLECGRSDVARSGYEDEIMRFAHWTRAQLNGETAVLRQLPDQRSLWAPDGSELRVTHAAMGNNRDGVYEKTPDGELRRQIGPPPAVFVTAHTHRPLIRHLDDTLVANVGSVGAPFDADNRLSYGQFTWDRRGWQAQIVRLAYDYGQTERDYVQSGFLDEGGPLAQLMLVELRRAGGLIYRWASRYQEAVLAGEISLKNSVRQLLRDADLRPYLGSPGWEL